MAQSQPKPEIPTQPWGLVRFSKFESELGPHSYFEAIAAVKSMTLYLGKACWMNNARNLRSVTDKK